MKKFYVSVDDSLTEKRKLNVYKITVYCVIFYALWSVRELIIRPQFLDSLDGISFQIVESLMKLLVWTLPAILLIRHFDDDMWISLKEMFTTRVNWIWYILILTAFFIYSAARAWFSFGEIVVHSDFNPVALMETFVFVGVAEEIVFRGWLLNALLNKIKRWYAVLLNAVLFALIHFPIWLYYGYDVVTILSSSISVMAISVIFAWTFIKSKNIIVPMVIHMGWNLFIILFFG